MTSGKALIFRCHFTGFMETETSFPGIPSSFSSSIIGMMRMEWNGSTMINQKQKRQSTKNATCQ